MKWISIHLPQSRTLYLDRIESAIKWNESKYKETQDERYRGHLKTLYQLKEKLK